MNTNVEDKLRQAILAMRTLRDQVEQLRAERKPPVAVVGMACRLPGGVAQPQDFWQLLREGRDAVSDVPPQRWDVERWYDPDPDTPGKSNTRRGAFIEGIDQFDAGFFEIAAREAAAMDPQQRLLLECAWEALENGCLAPSGTLARRTGVYVGINGSDYHQMAMRSPQTLDAHALSGTVSSVAAGRIAYALGLQGPALAIDTACSSSLTALHLAVQALRAGEIDAALVGGVYAVLEPHLTVALSKFRMLAPDGRCKTFDAAADGFAQGEGCVVLLLQRATDAQRASRPIHAVIRGSAANQDGRTSSLTAPSRSAQAAVVQAALDDAGIAPGQVGFVETHGTGTALGDPIEFDALAQALAGPRAAPVVLGALKTNLGHLGPAAGIAGLLKAVLAVREGEIPPNLHLQRLNPAIDPARLAHVLPTRMLPWPALPGLRTAGASSFGFSGTNVHVVVQQWHAPAEAPAEADMPVVLAVSGRSAAACEAARQRLQAALHDGAPLAAMARTSLLGRRQFEYRVTVVAATPAQAHAALAQAGAPVLVSPTVQPGVCWAAPGADAGSAAVLAAWDALAEAHAALACSGMQMPLHAGRGVGVWAAAAAAGLASWEALRAALSEALTRPGVPPALPAAAELPATAALVLANGQVAHRLDATVATALTQALTDAAPPHQLASIQAVLDGQGATLMLLLDAGVETTEPVSPGRLPCLRWPLAPGAIQRDGLWALLARLHTHGVVLAWDRILPPGPMAPLPTYPFQRRRHWRDVLTDTPAPGAAPRATLAPNWLPGSPLRRDPGAPVGFLLRLGLSTHPWLGDHRVHGRAVVPGALQLLAMAAGWQQLRGGSACRLRAVTFGRPLVLPDDGGTLSLRLLLADDGNARLEDADGPGLPYASAMVDAAPALPTLSAVPASLDGGQSLALPTWRDRLATIGIAIGPAFQGLVRLDCAPGRARGEVVLPAGLEHVAGWHPAQLDACLQVAGGALSADEGDAGALLPVGIDEVLLRPLGPGPLQVQASGQWHGEVFSSDVAVQDAEGVPCLRLRGLHVRRAPVHLLEASGVKPVLPMALTWPEVPLDGICAAAPADVLAVLPPGSDLANMAPWLAALERAAGAVRVAADDAALDAALRAQPAPRVVAALALGASDVADDGCALAGWLALLANRLDALPDPPRLALVTHGAWGTTTRPAQAAAWGMALTVSLEAGRLQPVCLDVDTPAALHAEWTAGLPAEWVAWNRGQRTVPRLAPLPATTAPAVRLRGTVLITGALGGIGRELVRWAVARGGQHLLLAVHRLPDAQTQAELDALPVPVTLWVGDLSQPGAVQTLLQAAPQPVRAVLHAAGAQAPGLLATLMPHQLAKAWDAKAQAAWTLSRLAGELDVFVLCSSLASLLGAAGQGGYAAANALLDALARHRHAQGLPATSVLWGAWDGPGMLASVDATRRRQIEALGLRPLAPARAIAALDGAIGCGLPAVLVADADWPKLMHCQRPGRPLPWLAGALPEPSAAAPSGAVAGDPLDWLLDVLRQVLQVPAGESLDTDAALVRLGLDSLMAVELRARIQRERGILLSVAPLLSGASVREVAALLAASPTPTDDWEEIRL